MALSVTSLFDWPVCAFPPGVLGHVSRFLWVIPVALEAIGSKALLHGAHIAEAAESSARVCNALSVTDLGDDP
jgi:alpha-D-ribose 1-methylphosphonate 5-triphosphate synthase subunit PhnL